MGIVYRPDEVGSKTWPDPYHYELADAGIEAGADAAREEAYDAARKLAPRVGAALTASTADPMGRVGIGSATAVFPCHYRCRAISWSIEEGR